MKQLISLGSFTLFALSITAYGAVRTKISRVENHEVFATNGRVYGIDENNYELLSNLLSAKESGASVSLNLEEGAPVSPETIERITGIEAQEEPPEPLNVPAKGLDPMTDYEPSNVGTLALATEMFDRLKARTKIFSQCFNRAHIWARQMHKDYGVRSQKILIYYTKKFRKEVDKKWWFHIAPMITVNGQKYVMDREFTEAPATDEDWESIFTEKMKSKGITRANYRCRVIKNISEFYQDTNPDYCNIQHTSMYYWEPNDMENLESTGVQKTQWINWELKLAAQDFLKDWKKIYPQYKIEE